MVTIHTEKKQALNTVVYRKGDMFYGDQNSLLLDDKQSILFKTCSQNTLCSIESKPKILLSLRREFHRLEI